jgi:hypothetical protein
MDDIITLDQYTQYTMRRHYLSISLPIFITLSHPGNLIYNLCHHYLTFQSITLYTGYLKTSLPFHFLPIYFLFHFPMTTFDVFCHSTIDDITVLLQNISLLPRLLFIFLPYRYMLLTKFTDFFFFFTIPLTIFFLPLRVQIDLAIPDQLTGNFIYFL